MKAELKTKPTKNSVNAFIGAIPDDARRRECRTVMQIMKAATGANPRMWGTSIVGFGEYRYKYASGREGDWFVAGFSPRKDQLTLYLMSGLDRQQSILNRLGRYRTGKSCLYLERLSDIDLEVLKELVESSVRRMESLREDGAAGP
jgi:hypothetical protein